MARTSSCYLCAEEGHIKRNRPKGKETSPLKGLEKGVCFQCKQPGHFTRDCRKRLKVEQAKAQAQKMGEACGSRQGCVFELIKEDVRTGPVVVQGMLFILEIPVHALIDPGLTHSFMSRVLVESLGVKTEPMGFSMIILTPIGKSMKSSEMIEGCEISPSDIRF